jgi:hypothetical protein
VPYRGPALASWLPVIIRLSLSDAEQKQFTETTRVLLSPPINRSARGVLRCSTRDRRKGSVFDVAATEPRLPELVGETLPAPPEVRVAVRPVFSHVFGSVIR